MTWTNKIKCMKKITLIWFLLILVSFAPEPTRFDELKDKLETFSSTIPALNETVELSVDGVTVADFLRMLSKSNELNISIQDGVQGNVVNDFNNAKVKDILLYLCKEYTLDIEFIGNILFFKKYIAPVTVEKIVKKELQVSYKKENQFLSVDLEGEDVSEVAKVISEKSGNTVVVYPMARGTKINGFIQNRPFDQVLDNLMIGNGLIVVKKKDGFYVINKEIIERNNKSNTGSNKTNSSDLIQINVKDNLFSIEANDAPISDIIMLLSEKLNKNYFFYGFPEGKTTLYIDNMSYEDFLLSILTGTKYTYKKTENVYLIGDRKKEGFRTTELITLKNRSIEKVLEIIPPDLQTNLKVSVFNDLNGLVVSGSTEEIFELKNFVQTIDVVVPVVNIDLIIIETTKSNRTSGGVEAGLGNSPNIITTTGSSNSGLNVNLSTDAINNLLQTINGLGAFNLGNVAPNFYMNIEALEINQRLKIKSTPKIATLNGTEAILTIGNEEWYLENNNQVVNTGVTQTLLNTQVYKSVNADLTIKITPFVSEDEQISLTIDFTQASFTPPIAETAPPGTTSRSFNSVIRVKNNDMVLLGGLERETKNDAGEGIPFLSRIPILKWLFGTRQKEKTITKLHIFIRPHVTY